VSPKIQKVSAGEQKQQSREQKEKEKGRLNNISADNGSAIPFLSQIIVFFGLVLSDFDPLFCSICCIS